MKIYVICLSLICCTFANAGVSRVSESKGVLPVYFMSQDEVDGWIRYVDLRFHNLPAVIPNSALQMQSIYLQDVLFGHMYVPPKPGWYVYVFAVKVKTASGTRRYGFEFASPRSAGQEVANLEEFWHSVSISRYAVYCNKLGTTDPTPDFVIIDGARQ